MAEKEPGNKRPRRIRSTETLRDQVERNNVTAPAKKPGSLLGRLRAASIPFRWLGQFRVFHIIGLILVPRYFRNSWRELRLVTWPNKKESRRLTLAVMLFAILFGIVIAIVDYGLDKIFRRVLLK
ncbi:MAG TPA: preprotein translocase subunit SecE [Candidatus Saccharimonadales bacterium]|nr:preprotein translocase subunit SecE [Candidatus Saccharimonadales bacterium]